MFIVNLQIVYICEDEILAIIRGENETHAPNTCDIPGGKLELFEIGENALELGALRELEEETGIKESALPNYVCSSTFIADDGSHVANLVYSLKVKEKHEPTAGADEAGAFWMSIDDFISDSRTQPWSKAYVARAIKE